MRSRELYIPDGIWMEKESERWSENFISLQEEWNKGTFNPSIKKKRKTAFYL